jgi:hypothetical protein
VKLKKEISCQYIQSILNLILNNEETFQTNLEIHNINTRNKHHLHRPNAKLSSLQKSAYCAGIGIFNTLPLFLSVLMNHNVMPDMLHTLKYSASWGFCSSRDLYSANTCFVLGLGFRPWQEKVFLSRRTLHLLTGVDSAEFLRGSGAESNVCVCVGRQGQPNSSSAGA